MVADRTVRTPPMCLYYNQDLTLLETLIAISKTQLDERDYLKVMAIEWTSLKGCWIQKLKDLVRDESFTADIISLENMIVQILLNLKRISNRDTQFKEEFMMWALPVQINEEDVEWEKMVMILHAFKVEDNGKEKKTRENVINVPLGSQKITKLDEFLISLKLKPQDIYKETAKMEKKTKLQLRKNRFKEMIDFWPTTHQQRKTMSDMIKFNFKAQKWKLKRELLFYLQSSKLVKDIFDYNNLLINFSMTSSKNNKLINKLFKLIKIKINYKMMTSSWTTKKNYAALIRDKNIDPEIYLDYNQTNLNICVWIKNWEIEKIKEFCLKGKKQWEYVSDENNEEINQILEFKQWKNLAKEWCKFYLNKKENQMEQDESQNRIEA